MSIWRKQAGDTLIEVTLALTILALVIVGSTALATRAFRLGEAAKEDTVAANLIQQQAEGLRNIRDSDVASGGTGTWGTFHTATVTGSVFHVTPTGNGGRWAVVAGATAAIKPYTISIQSSDVAGTNGEEVKYDITATWQPQGSGPTYSLTISTYLVDEDLLAPCNNGAGGCFAPPGGVPVLPSPPSFSASSTSIYAGIGSTTLNWNCTDSNDTSATASGGWSGSNWSGSETAFSGSQTIPAPATAGTYTFTLVCNGPGGTSSPTPVTVTVTNPPAPTITFTPASQTLTSFFRLPVYATVNWSTTNATSCTGIDGGSPYDFGWAGPQPTSGSNVIIGPITFGFPGDISMGFGLKCTGPGGSETKWVSVIVLQEYY